MNCPESAHRAFWWIAAPVWFPLILAIGVARGALGFVLEEGWGKRFFNAIGITASS